MMLRINLQNEMRVEARCHKDIELHFVPSVDMHLVLAEMPDNRDIVGGPVTHVEHDFRTGLTYVTCLVLLTEDDLDEFAQHHNWSKGYG